MQSNSLINPSFSNIQFFNFVRNYFNVEVVICVNYSEESIVFDMYISDISIIFLSSNSSKR